MMSYNILWAHPYGGMSPSLLSAASTVWAWHSIVKGEGLVGRCCLHGIPVLNGQPCDWKVLQNNWSQLPSTSGNLSNPIDGESTHKNVQGVPDEIRNEILNIVKSRPYGIVFHDLERELTKSKPYIDKNYYGYGTVISLLLSTPGLKARQVRTRSNRRTYLFQLVATKNRDSFSLREKASDSEKQILPIEGTDTRPSQKKCPIAEKADQLVETQKKPSPIGRIPSTTAQMSDQLEKPQQKFPFEGESVASAQGTNGLKGTPAFVSHEEPIEIEHSAPVSLVEPIEIGHFASNEKSEKTQNMPLERVDDGPAERKSSRISSVFDRVLQVFSFESGRWSSHADEEVSGLSGRECAAPAGKHEGKRDTLGKVNGTKEQNIVTEENTCSKQKSFGKRMKEWWHSKVHETVQILFSHNGVDPSVSKKDSWFFRLMAMHSIKELTPKCSKTKCSPVKESFDKEQRASPASDHSPIKKLHEDHRENVVDGGEGMPAAFLSEKLWENLWNYLRSAKGSLEVCHTMSKMELFFLLKDSNIQELSSLDRAQLSQLVDILIEDRKWLQVHPYHWHPVTLHIPERFFVSKWADHQRSICTSIVTTTKEGINSASERIDRQDQDSEENSTPPTFQEFKWWLEEVLKHNRSLDIQMIDVRFRKEFGVTINCNKYGQNNLKNLLVACSDVAQIVRLNSDDYVILGSLKDKHRDSSAIRTSATVLEDCKNLLQDVLWSCKTGIPICIVPMAFEERYGYRMCYKPLGFKNFTAVLAEMEDTVIIGNQGDTKVVLPSVDLLSKMKNERKRRARQKRRKILSDTTCKSDMLEMNGTVSCHDSSTQEDMGSPETFDNADEWLQELGPVVSCSSGADSETVYLK